jgi:2-phosphosulfolactate phosphatase
MSKPTHPFSQEPYRIRIHWGDIGASHAADRGDIIVIIDMLDFSTAVTTAVAQGAIVYPVSKKEHLEKVASEVGGQIAKSKQEAAESGFSLSPLHMMRAKPGDKIVLQSNNGAYDTDHAQNACCILVGTMLNAPAVARVVRNILGSTNLRCTINPCGERWPDEKEFRPAIEDHLAAAAIVHEIGLHAYLSPEAEVIEAAWRQLETQYKRLILDSGSGRKESEEGVGDDTEFALDYGRFDVVPILKDGAFQKFDEEESAEARPLPTLGSANPDDPSFAPGFHSSATHGTRP